MVYLAWVFQAMFCKHKFSYDEMQVVINDNYGNIQKKGLKVSATCDKCGWHRKYWKHM